MKKVKIIATICSLVMAIAMLGFATFAAFSTTTALNNGRVVISGATGYNISLKDADGNWLIMDTSAIDPEQHLPVTDKVAAADIQDGTYDTLADIELDTTSTWFGFNIVLDTDTTSAIDLYLQNIIITYTYDAWDAIEAEAVSKEVTITEATENTFYSVAGRTGGDEMFIKNTLLPNDGTQVSIYVKIAVPDDLHISGKDVGGNVVVGSVITYDIEFVVGAEQAA